ncbi:NTP transferase domain-containing protein [Bacillus cereus group sp. N11]|uniref:sugar phosphate nucleotidyltransferase n=1 Tax=Bacillus cereus group sp. N11 TaxID=2794585 RepID=UPI0018F4DB64|nr:sugar phosphate nucleotidyltransferase [Bacillus cereus group sp. N11]MBJ8098914.1 NTP transferase domain-containing protein [Bacillus cereus group sp. N11]
MRAILLAAGMGTRLRPLTLTKPKSLVEVNGKPMLERQIEYLQEIGIDEIIVVTGYLSEKFNYLVDKYENIRLVYNDKYNVYNNIYTMYVVREYLADAYVVDADVYLHRNIFIEKPESSLYFSARKEDFRNEWIIKHDESKKVYDIEIGDGHDDYILCGLSYWCKDDADYIVKELEKAVEQEDFSELYWDNIVKDNIGHLNVYLYEIDSNDSFEIDSVEDLEKVEEKLATLRS